MASARLGLQASGLYRLLAMAAIAVTALCAILAYQLLVPRNAKSEAIGTSGPAHAIREPASSEPVSSAPPAGGAAPAPACYDCGQIVNIRAVRQEGSGSGIGAVAGGLVGGLLGHGVGAGRGKDAMTIVGAVGGAVAGNQVEKQATAQTVYVVDVRMADGTVRSITGPFSPALAVGMQVHVAGDRITPL
jgi:outer membrane lipoprotein SlyB